MVVLDVAQRRLRTGVVLGTLTATALFTAQGTTQWVGAALLGDAVAQAAPPASIDPASVHLRPDRTELGRAILQRDIFDSATGALDWEAPPETPAPDPSEEGEETEAVDPNRPPEPYPGSERITVILVLQPPRQSYVTIAMPDGAARVLTSGEALNEDYTVDTIETERMIVHNASGARFFLALFDETEVEAPAPPRPTIARPVPPPQEPANDEYSQNIRQLSENSYAVNRGFVDRLLSNQAELMRTARVIPHEVDGRVVGVKIYGIRRSSVLGHLGVQNGDMLRTINGYDLSAPDSVLEAYTNLRTAPHLSLSIERRGQPVNLDFTIE